MQYGWGHKHEEVVLDTWATVSGKVMQRDLTILRWKDSCARNFPNHVTYLQNFFCTDHHWRRSTPMRRTICRRLSRKAQSRRVTIITWENVIFDPFRKRESFGWAVYPYSLVCLPFLFPAYLYNNKSDMLMLSALNITLHISSLLQHIICHTMRVWGFEPLWRGRQRCRDGATNGD